MSSKREDLRLLNMLKLLIEHKKPNIYSQCLKECIECISLTNNQEKNEVKVCNVYKLQADMM